MPDNSYPIEKRLYELSESFSGTPEVQIVRMKPVNQKPMNFDPGMFAMISGVEKDTGKLLVARAFSIASEPNSQDLEFFVVKEHGGHASYLTISKPGDRYYVVGPHGQFKYVPQEDSKVLFVAGGTGLAPFMSMIRHIKNTNAKIDAMLLYSVKFPTEIICREELERTCADLGMPLAVTVTRPQDGDQWKGETGHINGSMISRHAPDVKDRTTYICGPLAFVKAVKDALAGLDVANEKIKADVWG
ncbi:hypothetical protein M1439_01095 [Candidatus Marsarchaeota archaeon]|jgi:ferredoxin-NADP reductase|nr:hypothetical protein [Candidatus Marsarchaeota archaeon]MCL5092453.1 hypothetical protein [Candidatus Marsarchaeota archaeon]